MGVTFDAGPKKNEVKINKKAGLSTSELAMLKIRALNIQATAKEKGNSPLDSWDLQNEIWHAEKHFELGCWLYFYSKKVGKEGSAGLFFRIGCLKKIIKSGIEKTGYSFFTVFDFGEREYDTIFEMGDGDLVKKAILAEIPKDTTGLFKTYCANMGWLN